MTTPLGHQRGLDDVKPVAPPTAEEIERKYGVKNVIKLSSNENPLGPSPKAVAAIEKVLSELHLYPDSQSYYLRQALATHLNVSSEQVIMGNGADGIIRRTCMAYLDEGDEVIVSQSSFSVYDRFTLTMRATLVKTPLKDYCLDLDAMAAAITDKTRLIFVCNPNNPTATIVTADEVDAFLKKVPDRVLVIFDEAYYDFVESAEYPDTLAYVRAGRGNVMVMRTFSKVYGLAGIRLGYGIAAPQILAPLNRNKDPFAVNRLAQVAGMAALEDRAFLERVVAANRAGHLYLYGEFDRMGLRYIESQTSFMLIEIGPQALAVRERLREQSIMVSTASGNGLGDFLRITVGNEEQNARLIEALEDVLES